MKTKVETTIHPFRLQGVSGVFFYTEVITSRNHIRTYEMIPNCELIYNLKGLKDVT